ncbi:hypothetical protein EAG_11209 [Camponotus floridanus]|uniref:Uncharacterized protein n=1 Tax=Camponotus floridanus TaxID=104421 RepID=E2A0L5_CAMFO|nr:hypothetical protein EAG_11209 [Camponotus floridanus]
MIRREEARWKERVAGRKGGREKEARVRCEEGTGRGKVAAGGKRGSRHETATERRELAFTKHQNGTYRGPVISPYSFRIRIGDDFLPEDCISSKNGEIEDAPVASFGGGGLAAAVMIVMVTVVVVLVHGEEEKEEEEEEEENGVSWWGQLFSLLSRILLVGVRQHSKIVVT